MNIFRVNLNRFLFEEDDGPDNPILVAIERIDKPTKFFFFGTIFFGTIANDILIEEDSSLLRERLQRLFRIVSKNRNIVELVLRNDFHIPGRLLAEWLDSNEFVSTIHINLPKNQSDIELLCDALKRNTNVKTVIFYEVYIEGSNLQLVGKTLGESKEIQNIKFHQCYSTRAITMILNHALRKTVRGRNSNIKSLTFSYFYGTVMSIEFVNEIERILSRNTSLVSLKILHTDLHDGRNCVAAPIFRGVINSAITDFHLTRTSHRLLKAECQRELLQTIGEMKNLKSFSFRLRDFIKLSAEIIYTTLKGMDSLALLTIEQSKHLEMSRLKGIIRHMVADEWYCKLHLTCSDPDMQLIDLLRSTQLESFECCIFDYRTFDKITEEIPTWNHLKELLVHITPIHITPNCLSTHNDKNHKVYENKIISAIERNISLKSIAADPEFFVTQKTNFFRVDAQKIVDKILARNEHLAICMNSPEFVPVTNWPELFVRADPTGLNFSYECIRKIPDVFTNLFRGE